LGVVSKTKPQAWRGRVHKLLMRYEPDLVVLADIDEPRRGRWAKRFTIDI
jgi:hypothetical protein